MSKSVKIFVIFMIVISTLFTISVVYILISCLGSSVCLPVEKNLNDSLYEIIWIDTLPKTEYGIAAKRIW